MKHPSIAIIALIATQAHLAADVVYDESVSGDLSNNSVAPTSLGTIEDPVLLVKGSVPGPNGGLVVIRPAAPLEVLS